MLNSSVPKVSKHTKILLFDLRKRHRNVSYCELVNKEITAKNLYKFQI